MPRCEMCGSEQDTLKSVQIDYAELEVCDSCSSIGTPLESDEDEEDEEQTSTKYSTGSSTHSDSLGQSPSDMAPKLVQDYAARIQTGREQSQLTIDELADQLNAKASYLRKIEQGEMTPDTSTQMQLEQFLNITLSIDDDQ